MSASPPPESIPSRRHALVLLLIVAAFGALRLAWVPVPLDRDEGGYAYGAQQILAGGSTYVDFHTMRYPAVFGAYAVIIALLGPTATAIHAGLLIMSCATIIFVFVLARRLHDAATGLCAAALFAVLELSATTEGYSANSEQFVIAFACAGLWLVVRGTDLVRPATVVAGGICLGVAYLMKQHGIVFLAAAASYIVLASGKNIVPRTRRLATPIALFAGAAIPVIGTGIHIAATGRWAPFTLWTIEYASGYASSASLAQGLEVLAHRLPTVVLPTVAVWLLAAAGLGMAWRASGPRKALFLLGLLVLSLCATGIGFYFRAHYFRFLFPALALLAGTAATAIARRTTDERRATLVAGLLCVAAAAATIVHQRAVLFELSPPEISRAVGGLNPAPESPVIAAYLREHTNDNDTIAVIGSEPQLYFLAQRRAATRHLYTYPMMEIHEHARIMQDEMIREIESARPAYIVFVYAPTSWLIHDGADLHILEWTDAYLRNHYEKVGLVDIVAPGDTRVYWDEAATRARPQSPYHLSIHRRKSG